MLFVSLFYLTESLVALQFCIEIVYQITFNFFNCNLINTLKVMLLKKKTIYLIVSFLVLRNSKLFVESKNMNASLKNSKISQICY